MNQDDSLPPLRRTVARRRVVRLARWTCACAGSTVAALVMLGWLCPFPEALLAPPAAATRVLAADGTELRILLDADDRLCLPVPLDQVSPRFVQALIAAEDQRFRAHRGVDGVAVARALLGNLMSGRTVSGASTLTMQVIRLLEGRPRGIGTKLYEAFRALQLERLRTKDAILAEYVNRAPFGGNLVGVEAAARRYFGVSAADLNLGQAALLAGLVQAPSRLDPVRHPERARARRDYVLARMAAEGMIGAAEAAVAADEPLPARHLPLPFVAPAFVEQVLARVRRTEGGVVRTTLDPFVQRTAERLLQERLRELAGDGIEGGGAVVLENADGAVRALASTFTARSGAAQVDATRAARCPGSTLKPFLYAQAIDAGRLTPATALFDVPMAWRDYSPADFAGGWRGPVPAGEALAQSLNLPAVRLLEQVGVAAWADTLARLGVVADAAAARRHGLGLALGSCPVRLLELAAAYAALARGRRPGVRWLVGEPSAEEDGGAAVFSAEAAWLVLHMLARDPLPECLPAGAAGGRVAPIEVAWKTGTSNGLRDAWTVAVSPRWTVAVWLGDPGGRAAAALVGRSAAAPLAGRILRDLLADPATGQGPPDFSRPAGIAVRAVCAASGAPPGPHCPATVEDCWIPGVSPTAVCAVHRAITVDVARGVEVCRRCRGAGAVRARSVERWPAEVEAFLRAADPRRPEAFRHDPACPGGGAGLAALTGGALAVLSPPSGQAYRRLPDDTGLSQRVPLKAGGARGQVWWFVDGRLLGSAAPGVDLFWDLEPGDHRIEAVDEGGARSEARVRVAGVERNAE
ncbi:MAG: penicillin-binding protein 1C [Planctomycetes bacterium]|nr:penicillin-binding protein 1C [Planctomycetota bacterium]